jgi:NAD(P)-dependent dehydrogenase (short-subunit alcohol dehydrogenase family)
VAIHRIQDSQMALSPEISQLFGLAGKVAVVTGAATGIGREIARLFDQAGATVIAADINDEVQSFLTEARGAARAVRLDQGDPASITALFEAVRAHEGRLDVLVNCAAIFSFTPFEEVDTALLDRTIAVDLRGVFQCVQGAVGIMKAQETGGSIINISSVNSLKACIYDNVHYGLSKAGVNNITVSVALEYAAHNIRVNAVLPGGVATPRAGAAAEDYPLQGPFTQAGRMPLGNTSCGPDQIANACLFLASDASSYVTGQLLAVDGGFLVS